MNWVFHVGLEPSWLSSPGSILMRKCKVNCKSWTLRAVSLVLCAGAEPGTEVRPSSLKHFSLCWSDRPSGSLLCRAGQVCLLYCEGTDSTSNAVCQQSRVRAELPSPCLALGGSTRPGTGCTLEFSGSWFSLYDPAVSLLGTYPKEMTSLSQRYVHSRAQRSIIHNGKYMEQVSTGR